MAVHSRRRALAVLAAAATFLVLAVAAGRTWRYQHDEGVTFDAAVTAFTPEVLDGSASSLGKALACVDGTRIARPSEVLEVLTRSRRAPHPPAFYLLCNGWSRIAGTGRVAARVPLYLIGILTVLGLARLAGALVSHPAAPAAAAWLAATNAWLVELSNFLRPYALALCAAVWATVLAVEIKHKVGGWTRRLAFAAVSLLGMYTVYHYAFVLAWHLAILALPGSWRGFRTAFKEALAAAAAPAVLVALGFAPWIPTLLRHQSSAGDGTYFFSGLPSFTEWWVRFGLVVERFAVGQEFPLPMLAWMLGAALLWPLVRSFRRPDPSRAATSTWRLAALLPGLLLAADLAQRTGTMLVAKYSFGLFPLLVLLCARGWTLGAGPRLGRLGLVSTVAVFAAATLNEIRAAKAQPEDIREIVTALSRADRADHLVVLSRTSRGHAVPLLLECRDQGVRALRIDARPEEELDAALRAALFDGSTRTITLLNFQVGADKPVQAWPKAALDDAERLCEGEGWTVTRCTLDDLSAVGSGVAIVDGIRALTYHRPRIGSQRTREEKLQHRERSRATREASSSSP